MAGRGLAPDGLRLSVTTFTVLPVRVGRVDRRTAGRAVLWSPAVGAGLGGLAALVIYGVRWPLTGPPGALLAGALGIATLALVTRGLHLDGLADTADGLGGNCPAGRALEIMRRSDVGPFGVVTVVLTLLVQIGALAACVAAGRGVEAIVLAAVAGRMAVVHSSTPATPAARSEGLGALVAGTVSLPAAALVTAVAIACCAVPAGLGDPVRAARLGSALLVGLVAAAVLRRHAVRRFGGVTGDVYGALVEIDTTAVLLVLALWG
ncbi:MAG: adenosylcobinamide-GDP ribazoletransferase [Streptosporangiaceae bacterium]